VKTEVQNYLKRLDSAGVSLRAPLEFILVKTGTGMTKKGKPGLFTSPSNMLVWRYQGGKMTIIIEDFPQQAEGE
jgi:hypothetical protein